MRLLQRIGLFSVTIFLLLGFWAGLWYHGYRKSGVTFYAPAGGKEAAASSGAASGTGSGSVSGAVSGLNSATGSGSGSASGSDPVSGYGPSSGSSSANASGLNSASGYGGGVSGGVGDSALTDRFPGESAGAALADGDSGAINPAGSAGDRLAVHVVGQVATPGLYYMPPGSRIYDAVMEAKPEEDANLARINMASLVEDGMQIRVPAIGKPSPWDGEGYVVRSGGDQENVTGGNVSGGTVTGGNVTGSGTSTMSNKININKASQAELQKLPGIGPAYSLRIIQYREQYGAFKTVEDLQKVKGIGPAKMGELRELVTCS